jgi:hypothetical protein
LSVVFVLAFGEVIYEPAVESCVGGGGGSAGCAATVPPVAAHAARISISWDVRFMRHLHGIEPTPMTE